MINMISHFRAAMLTAALTLTAAPATADSFVDAINEALSRVAEDRRSDLVVLPALIEMSAPPELVMRRPDVAGLISPAGPLWDDATAWASAEPQQGVLDAIVEVTEETNPRRAMRFALPYGIGAVPTAFIRAGVHAELGDPPTIASAQLGYMPRFVWTAVLVDIETSRLIEEGDPEKAIELNIHLARFARQIADRQLGEEVEWAYSTIARAMRRIRDVVYVDSKNDAKLSSAFLIEVVEGIDVDRGLYRVDRFRLPEGDRQAALQLVERVFNGSGRPDPAVFPTAMAQMAATARPLRLFAEAGRWSGELSSHASADETRRMIDGIFNDWNTRWSFDPFDPIQSSRSVYRSIGDQAQGFAVVTESVPDLGTLIALRKVVQVETVGTRCALASQALTIATGARASTLAILRPRYIDDLGVDPFNPDVDLNNRPELLYFVPERDDIRGEVHRMNIEPPIDAPFSVVLTDDDFVIYSPGGNGADERAVNVSTNPEAAFGDYLIWPPVISLARDYLELSGESR
ncbi:MAG: hypothetical protein AAFR96_10140 [Planctomycetota bacterium]